MEQWKENPDNSSLHKWGTSYYGTSNNILGILPTRNFREGSFEGAEKIFEEGLAEITIGIEGCYACPVSCKRKVKA